MRAPRNRPRPAKCSLDELSCQKEVFAISFGREKIEGFSIFSRWTFLQCCSFTILFFNKFSMWAKYHIWGHIGAFLGSSWGILKDFAALLGPIGSPCGTPLAPQNREKVGQTVFPDFHWFPGGVERRQKGPQKGPKEHSKVTKRRLQIDQIGTQCIS